MLVKVHIQYLKATKASLPMVFLVCETEYTAYYRCFHTNSHVLPHIDIKFDTLFLISATARQFARQVRFYNMHGQFANFPHKLCRQIILFNSAVCRKNVDTVVKIVYNVKQILRLRHKAQVLQGFPQQKRDNEKIVIPSIALQAHALQSKVQCAVFEYVPHNTSTRQIGIYTCEDSSL